MVRAIKWVDEVSEAGVRLVSQGMRDREGGREGGREREID